MTTPTPPSTPAVPDQSPGVDPGLGGQGGDLEPAPPATWTTPTPTTGSTPTPGAGVWVSVRAGVGNVRVWARRYLPVYRWAAELTDTTIAATVAAGWGAWLLGGLLVVMAGLPGSAVVGAVLAVGLLAGDGVVVSWWMGYRRAPARLRHEILARTQIAAGRELADSPLAPAQVTALGTHVRPTLANHQVTTTGRARVRVPVATGPTGTSRPLRPGTLPECPATRAARVSMRGGT